MGRTDIHVGSMSLATTAPWGDLFGQPGWHAAGGAFEVLCHDVGIDEPPAGPFDLVHARLVLVHVPQRSTALAAMVAALRPGGWLVLEDADPALQPLIRPDEYGRRSSWRTGCGGGSGRC